MSEPRCTALIVDDDFEMAAALSRLLQRHNCDAVTATSIADGRAAIARRTFDVAFVDFNLPDGDGSELIHLIVAERRARAAFCVTAEARVKSISAAVRAGATEVIEKPFDSVRLGDIIRAYRPIGDATDEWRRRADIDMVGDDAHTMEVLRFIRKVANSPATVLITGESGTGKEVVARALHQASSRRDRPMIAVNCAAIPETLIESELFGFARGAFTGADKARDGKLVAADGGTLFLDEIGDMPLMAQAKLLRVLQERAVTPVGSNTSTPIDIRVVAATNQDLERLVDEGKFRADLYFRLSVLPVELLPLRERPGDILPLARTFFERAGRAHGGATPVVHPSAEQALLSYSWPGNVRELANAIERALALADGPITAACLRLGSTRKRSAPAKLLLVSASNDSPSRPMATPLTSVAPAQSESAALLSAVASTSNDSLNLRARLDEVERQVIEQAISRAEGNRTEAAALLGLNRTTLVEKLRKLGT